MNTATHQREIDRRARQLLMMLSFSGGILSSEVGHLIRMRPTRTGRACGWVRPVQLVTAIERVLDRMK